MRGRWLALIAGGLLAACAKTPMQPKTPFVALNGPAIIAHRGGSLEAPENTLEAVRHGVAAGADWVEIDVTLSKDDHVVVIHDDTLERTTNGRGEVRQTTLEDLTQLRAGAPKWSNGAREAMMLAGVTPTDFGERFRDAKVPTLAQVLAVPDILFMIELKRFDEDPRRLVSKVIDAVYDAGAAHRVGLGSFATNLLWAARDRDSSLPLIGIADTQEDMKEMLQVPISVLAVRIDLADDALKAAPPELAVWCWTAYSPEIAAMLRDKGVHGIITDAPQAVVANLRAEPDIYIRPDEE